MFTVVNHQTRKLQSEFERKRREGERRRVEFEMRRIRAGGKVNE